MTVVVPTLAAAPALKDCLASLERQSFRDFDVVVVDNSGSGLARPAGLEASFRVVENRANLGFAAAINQGFRLSRAPFLAALNDDAVAAPGWLEALVEAIERRPDAGMCASRVLLAGTGKLDSAGMLLAGDGSSKQRGHLRPPEEFARQEEVLLASASAALYRRTMLEEVGLFDEDFFLYCEDTDLGLRARWAGWTCLYVPEAVVEHRYSHSAGRASRLKAYYVERNRLFVVVKNFPARALWKVPFFAAARYFWHVVLLARGEGRAAEFRREGHSAWELVRIVLAAHASLWGARRRLAIARRVIRRKRRISAREFCRLMRAHAIGLREVAAL
mgnify:CR=1 FL=1